jgi:plastin-1
LNNYPELVLLLFEDETIEKFSELPPEQILIRWINYMLNKAGSSTRITNFDSDLKDPAVFSILMCQLDQRVRPMNPSLTEHHEKAQFVIDTATSLGIQTFCRPTDICSGNPRMNLLLAAQIFNMVHGLKFPDGKVPEMILEKQSDVTLPLLPPELPRREPDQEKLCCVCCFFALC